MAAGMILRPGPAPGPCVSPTCGHSDCRWQREVAESLCTICGQPIGYLRCFYVHEPVSARRFDHAVCVEGDAVMARADDLSAPAVLRAAADLMDEGAAHGQRLDAYLMIEEAAERLAAEGAASGLGPAWKAANAATRALSEILPNVSAADLRAAADHAEASAT